MDFSDGKLRSLTIKQDCGESGKTNRLRMQKLNIGVFDKDPSLPPVVIKGIIVSDTVELTEIDLSALPSDF